MIMKSKSQGYGNVGLRRKDSITIKMTLMEVWLKVFFKLDL